MLIYKLQKPKHKRRKQSHGKIKNVLILEFKTPVGIKNHVWTLPVLVTIKLTLAADAILHSDQRFQFTSPNCKKVVDMKITQSMSLRGSCWYIDCVKNFFGHLKVEIPIFSSPQTFSEV